MREWIYLIMISLLAVASAVRAQDKVVLRHGEPSPAGNVLSAGTQGVRVSTNQGSLLVPWSSVLRVEGGSIDVEPYSEIADLAWRAPLRLGRGDPITSEPMFERLLFLLNDETGPTTRSALSGLMKCQLSRGARDLAVMTWGRWVDASIFATDENVYRPSSDDEYAWHASSSMASGSLAIEIAPFWAKDGQVSLLAEIDPPAGVTRGELLLGWFRSASRVASSLPPEFPEQSSTDATVLLVRDIVLAQAGPQDLARSARGRLIDRLQTTPANDWISSWLHMAIGRALIAERELGQRQLGVVHLLHVPAEWSAVTPDLARLALADAAATLESMGDQQGSDALLAELRRHNFAKLSPQEPLP